MAADAVSCDAARQPARHSHVDALETWDADMLRLELGDLQLEGFDLALAGFGMDELSSLLAAPTQGLTDPDDAPEPQAEVISALGDVWLLGRHRLVCGDCTDAETVGKALNGITPHLMAT